MLKMDNEIVDQKVKKEHPKGAMSDLFRTVPKYCTSIEVGVLDNSNIVLSMIYAEGGESPMAVLIDRIIIDKKHAASFAKILEEASNVPNSN